MWGVTSDIGPLRTVVVHQPGYEHTKVIPWNREALLFDDILDVEEAAPEHKVMTSTLEARGIEVIFLVDLLRDLFSVPMHRERVCLELFGSEFLAIVDQDCLEASHPIHGWPRHLGFEDGPFVSPLCNLYFTRDPAFAVPGGMAIARPAMAARRRESTLFRLIFELHPRFAGLPVYDELYFDERANVEGGDIIVVDPHTVIVGIGERTNDHGARRLAAHLLAKTTVERVLLLHMPGAREFMHLDTVMTFVSRRQVVTMPYLWDDASVFQKLARRVRAQCTELGGRYCGPEPESFARAGHLEIIRDGVGNRHYDSAIEGLQAEGVLREEDLVLVAGPKEYYPSREVHLVEALREQWNDAANTLALKPGQVIAYGRNDRTNRALAQAGIDVIPVPGGELVRGRGGVHCMTMPIVRAEL